MDSADAVEVLLGGDVHVNGFAFFDEKRNHDDRAIIEAGLLPSAVVLGMNGWGSVCDTGFGDGRENHVDGLVLEKLDGKSHFGDKEFSGRAGDGARNFNLFVGVWIHEGQDSFVAEEELEGAALEVKILEALVRAEMGLKEAAVGEVAELCFDDTTELAGASFEVRRDDFVDLSFEAKSHARFEFEGGNHDTPLLTEPLFAIKFIAQGAQRQAHASQEAVTGVTSSLRKREAEERTTPGGLWPKERAGVAGAFAEEFMT